MNFTTDPLEKLPDNKASEKCQQVVGFRCIVDPGEITSSINASLSTDSVDTAACSSTLLIESTDPDFS